MGSEAAKSVIQEIEEFPSSAYASALKSSESLNGKSMEVRGYDFNKGPNYDELLQSMLTTGFQASHLAQAIDLVNTMLDWDLTHEPVGEEEEDSGEAFRRSVKCKIFLGFTSNLVSSGLRDTIRFLVQHHMGLVTEVGFMVTEECVQVHVVVTTAGGVEEDLIKCLAPTYTGDFSLPGAQLRSKGLNRIGNLLVPNDNYCKFEDWIIPIFDELLKEQKEQGVIWTPSKVIARLGKEINNPNSYCFWAYKNDIPVFCPGLTDGSLGDMLYFHSYRNPGLVIDIIQGISRGLMIINTHPSSRPCWSSFMNFWGDCLSTV